MKADDPLWGVLKGTVETKKKTVFSILSNAQRHAMGPLKTRVGV